MKEILAEKLGESLQGPMEPSTPRTVHGSVALEGKATVVVGMRRVGKTTFLHQLRSRRLSEGTPRDHLPYLNFEDERLAGLDGTQLGFLLEEYARIASEPGPGKRIVWNFDEIQVVPGWERFVRRLLDAKSSEVFLTGSSAALLSGEMATSLRGRAWEVPLYPFGFAEFLAHRQIPVPGKPASPTGPERSRMEKAFQEWLRTGGFPEAQGLDEPTRRQLLMDYVDVALLRDVVERYSISNVAALRWLVRHLLGNAAGSFSIEKFHGTLKSQGLAVSRDMLHQMLHHLESAFLVRLVWMESSSERQRMVNARKAYPVDTGLIPVFDRTGRSGRGHALETAVLVELERRRREVTWVRTPSGFEVDFLARSPDGGTELVQVCADASDPDTAKRELRALEDAAGSFPEARKLLLVLTRDGMPSAAANGVEVRSAWEWMLGGD
jgi:predicted AAA+ superfamily ATPase